VGFLFTKDIVLRSQRGLWERGIEVKKLLLFCGFLFTKEVDVRFQRVRTPQRNFDHGGISRV